MNPKGILIVISGFSGAGKGTVLKRLLEIHQNYALSISMTSRNPRIGEQDGREYFFVSKEEFEGAIEREELIEYACYCGQYYGTPRRYVEQELATGRDVVLEIEIQGAMQIRKRFPDALLLFVTPPCATDLLKRLEGRGTESREAILNRLKRAVDESEGIEEYDYLLVNDQLEECVERTHQVIQAAHLAPHRNQELIRQIRAELHGL